MVLHEMANSLRQAAPPNPQPALRSSDPGALYATASDVLVDFSLSRADKIALLTRWREDIAMRSLARGEGMVGGDESLARAVSGINAALARLTRN
jgi:hypothetical protein